MRIVFFILVALVLAVSLFADYKWRRWMEARKRDRENPDRH